MPWRPRGAETGRLHLELEQKLERQRELDEIDELNRHIDAIDKATIQRVASQVPSVCGMTTPIARTPPVPAQASPLPAVNADVSSNSIHRRHASDHYD